MRNTAEKLAAARDSSPDKIDVGGVSLVVNRNVSPGRLHIAVGGGSRVTKLSVASEVELRALLAGHCFNASAYAEDGSGECQLLGNESPLPVHLEVPDGWTM